MTGDTTIVFGVPVPSVDPLFLAVVCFHILVGIACVVAGIAAMLRPKAPGPPFDVRNNLLLVTLSIVVASAVLSVVRWAEDYHLFFLGALSLIAATVARAALRQRWRNWVRLHITGMGLSYILMLTAFYVDNGKNLPLWRELPQWAFWCCQPRSGCRSCCTCFCAIPCLQRQSAHNFDDEPGRVRSPASWDCLSSGADRSHRSAGGSFLLRPTPGSGVAWSGRRVDR